MLGGIRADLRYALRTLARRPVFAATAISTIALGIGANAAVFTIVDGILLTPLPYEDPDELVVIWSENPSLGWSRTDVNAADAWDWRARARTLEDVAVFGEAGFAMTGADEPELVTGLRVTPNYLDILGVSPVLGRDFLAEESGGGRDRVVILSDGFWERRFGRDPGVVGSALSLDGAPVVVVGVLPPDFLHHGGRPDLLRPLTTAPADAHRGDHNAEAIARLADGATLDAARAELAAIAADLEQEHPENEGWTVGVFSLHEEVLGPIAGRASLVLMAAVSFILLMACVNVANLLLASGGGRAREIAVRLAIGAGRRRIVRQLLTESLLLAAVGGALGLLLGSWGYRAIEAALPPTMPPVFRFGMDGSVLAFTAAITLGAALGFGLTPALRSTRVPASGLREGRGTGRGVRASRFGGALVVTQTAMAVVLLVGGGLLMKSVFGMRGQDFGFDPTNVLTARVSLTAAEYPTDEEVDAFWAEVSDRLRAAPGVVGAGTTQSHPLMGSNWGMTVRVAGVAAAERDERSVRLTHASPGLFEALGFRMERGRTFTDADATGPMSAIVNETFVARYLGQRSDPLSASIETDEWTAPIVGVVEDVVERGIDKPPEPALYLPIDQGTRRARSLVVRTVGDPTDRVRALQEAVWSVDARLPVTQIETMETLIERRVAGFAVIGRVMGVFALISLLLGAIGIYGVTSHATGQRTSEIGLRLAMGAARGDVVRMVVREGGVRALVGLAIGLVLALAMGGALSGILVEVSPRDPATFVAVVGTLAVVSTLGLYLPARRAARVDPVRALASE